MRLVSLVMTVFVDALLLTWLALAPLCWVLSVGMGPNAVPTNGLAALMKFMTFLYWGPIFVALLIASIACHLGRVLHPEGEGIGAAGAQPKFWIWIPAAMVGCIAILFGHFFFG